MQTFLPTSFRESLFLSLYVSVSVELFLSCSICVWVCVCVCTIDVVLKVHGETLSVLTISNLMLTFSLPPSPVSVHLSISLCPSLFLSLPLCLPQSIQLYVAGMLEVPGEPSLVPAIQTATLHLSTVPGLLKSATGKARDTHRFTLLNRERQSERQQQVAHTSVVQLLLLYATATNFQFSMVYSIFTGTYIHSNLWLQCMYEEKLVEK